MSRRRKRIPQDPFNVEIENLSHDGRGIAHVEGKTLFVQGALAGEQVEVKYTACYSRYDEAIALNVIANPHADRVEPRCAHFHICGGCSLQHLSATAQRKLKQDTLLEQFEHIGHVRPEKILPALIGDDWGYRHKARLGVKYVPKKGGVLVGFREKSSSYIADMTQCEVLHPSVGHQIQALRSFFDQLEAKDKIAQIEVAVGDEKTALILRNLVPLSEADQNKLRLFAEESGFIIYLQSGGPATVTAFSPQPAPQLFYSLVSENIRVEFEPMDFTQVNPALNQKMVTRALDLLDIQAEDSILELFCGLGNFTLPLAKRSQYVTAIEGEASLIERARANAKRYELEVEYHVANLMEDNQQAVWMLKHYDKVLLDPPRSGAQEIIEQLDLSQTQKLLYISCNPATLARDAGILVEKHGFKLSQAGIMDMFPQTTHVESIALFER